MANKLIQHGGAAAATAAGGPVAGAAWEIGYPIVENWLTGSDAQTDAAKNQQAGMQKAADQYASYRQPAQQARQTALGNQLSAYGGAENAMNLMYGTQYDPRNYAPNLAQNPLLTGGGGGTAPGAGDKPPGGFSLPGSEPNSGSARFNTLSKAVSTARGASPIGAGEAAVGLFTGGNDPNRLWTLAPAVQEFSSKYGRQPSQQETQHYLETGVWTPPTGAT